MTFHKQFDVIISGAGPVGLFLACELALAKCSVLVLEKADDPHSPLKRLPFGIRGLSWPSIEALDRRGLLAGLEVHKRIQNPHKTDKPTGPQRQAGHFAGIPFLEGNVDTAQFPNRLPGSTPLSLISEMAELETVFAQRAEKLGVGIKRGCGVSGFKQNADGIEVHAGDQTLCASWLVGCDGSRSVVRKLGGFEFAGTEPEFTGYSAQIELADGEKLSAGRVLTPSGMYFQSQPGYLVMVEFDGGAGHRAEPVTLERMQETLRRVSNTDVTVTTLHAATTWTDRARQATRYRSGRALLAGDAAHIHSPLGGQGLNLGLGDAMNLGWKLAAEVHGRAPEGLLDTYEAERQPLGERVLDWSRAQVAIMRPDPAARALNGIFRDLINTRDGATYVAGRIWGAHQRYDFGSEQSFVGSSVTSFELKSGRTMGELMRDGKAVLLDFDSNASLEALAGRYGGQLKYVSGPAEEQLGLRAAFIRPDGFIAWVTKSEPDIVELQKALDRWLGEEHA